MSQFINRSSLFPGFADVFAAVMLVATTAFVLAGTVAMCV